VSALPSRLVRHLTVGAAALAVLAPSLLAGCGDIKQALRAHTVPPVTVAPDDLGSVPDPEDVDELATVVVDGTKSNGSEHRRFLEQLRDVVLPEIVRRRAVVEVLAITDASANSTDVLTTQRFDDLDDNPLIADGQVAERAQAIIDAISDLWARSPATKTDVMGALRRVAQRAAAYPRARLLLVLLTDGAANVAPCELQRPAMGSISSAASTCVGAEPLILRGDAILIGVGFDADRTLGAGRGAWITCVLERILGDAHARVLAVGVDLLPGVPIAEQPTRSLCE
jgi:hypothetical protein